MNRGNPPQTISERVATSPTEAKPDVFALWTTTPAVSTEAISFGVGSAPADDAPDLFPIDLPADPATAKALLSRYEEQIASADRALDAATDRLNVFVHTQTAAPSFSVGAPAAALGKPERAMLALLGEIQTGQPAVSFGLGETIEAGVDKVAEQFQAFVDRLLRSVTHHAWVETRVQGQLVCRTTIGWTGDTDTIWQAGINPAQIELHRRTVNIAVASRNNNIRRFITAAQGAIKLSALLSTGPGGLVLAMPAAWKFVNQILAELGQPAPTKVGATETQEESHG